MEWESKVALQDEDVYLVQKREFWGPVYAIVPSRCREIRTWKKAMLQSSHGKQDHFYQHKGESGEISFNLLSHRKRWRLSDGANSTNEGNQEFIEQSSLAIKIVRCNSTIMFKQVGYWHKYFSMVSLSSLLETQTVSVSKLHWSRVVTYYALAMAMLGCMCMKYSLQFADVATKIVGYRYVQLWNNGRTHFDRFLESLMLHGISIIFTLALQLSLCTCFWVFWRNDHFVLEYIPTVGFKLFFISMVMLTIIMVIDRVCGIMQAHDWYIYLFWITWTIWMLVVTVPMMGYCMCNLNFVWKASIDGWIDSERIFSDDFVAASVTAARCSCAFILIAVIDMIVVLLIDCERY